MTEAQVLQLHYTSCLQGISGYAGFQTRAESAGFLPGDRREIEGHILYQPPRDLPREPDPGTIKECFPRSFKVLRLASGRLAMIRSVYLGQDYSNRWGNFMGHALVFEGDLGGYWPIDAYAWPSWQDHCLEADQPQAPPPLPTLAPSEVLSGKGFSFAELSRFLGRSPHRAACLKEMIRAVFWRPRDSRSIVIRELLEEDAVAWVACLQKAFPPFAQGGLTCSTFQFDPGSAMAINATRIGTDFRFDDREREHQFYLFDFTTGRHSVVKEGHEDYAGTVAAWMLDDPERLEAFQIFAGRFAPVDLGPDLAHILQLFRFANGEAVHFQGGALKELLDFVKNRAGAGLLPELLEYLAAPELYLGQAAPLEDWSIAIRFLAEGADATGATRQQRQACKAWVQAFDHFSRQPTPPVSTLLSLRSVVERAGAGDPRALALAFLAEEHLHALRDQLATMSPAAMGLLLAEVERCCRKTGQEPTYKSEPVLGLLEAFLFQQPGPVPDLQWAYLPYRSQPEALVHLTRHLAAVMIHQWPGDQATGALASLGRSLEGALAQEGEAVRYQAINALKTQEACHEVLFGEWAAAIARSADKVESHARYGRAILTGEDAFSCAVAGRMAETLLEALAPALQRRQARLWIEQHYCVAFPEPLMFQVIVLASQDVALGPEDMASEGLAQRLALTQARNGGSPALPRLALRAAARRALGHEDGLEGLPSLLAEAEAPLYEEFAACVLPKLFARATRPARVRQILLAFASEGRIPCLTKAYEAALGTRSGPGINQTETAVLMFWLGLQETDPAHRLLGPLKHPALESLARRFTTLPPKELKSISAKAVSWKEPPDPLRDKALQKFIATVEVSRPTLINRLFGRTRA